MTDTIGGGIGDFFGVQTIKEVEEFAEGEITGVRKGIESGFNKAGILIQDTIRNTGGLADNTLSNFLYTVRDFKSELIHGLDSFGDNLASVVDNVQNNITDTVQLGALIGLSIFGVVLILFGDKIFTGGGFDISELSVF